MKSVIDKYGAAEKRGSPMTPAHTSREESLRLNEKTDPFAAPLAIQAAASAASETAASPEWESRSMSEPPNVDKVESHPVFNALSSRAGEEIPLRVEPDMKPDEPGENEAEDFDNLNLEGILDEALRVEEQEAAGESSLLETSFEDKNEPSSTPIGEAPPGILEETLGLDAETESLMSSAPATGDPFVENPLMADRPLLGSEESPLGQDEVDLLEDRFSQLETSPAGPSLGELAQTQIANEIDSVLESSTPEIKKETTSPEVRAPESVVVEAKAETHEVDVPIQLSISPDAGEVDVKITLHLRINRKTGPEK
jgi:hypothetical protein